MSFSMYRYLAAVLILASSSLSVAGSPFILVSDIDDTVRVTNVQYPIDAVLRFFLSDHYFAGMRELYSELSTEEGSELVFVSGSPQTFSSLVSESLVREGFQSFELHLKPSLFSSTAEFKSRVFEQISSASPLPLIFLGDDTEHDPDVTATFQQSHPDRSLKVYIHQVAGNPLPSELTPFFTAYEVALHEAIAQRLKPSQVVRVGERLLKVKEYNEIFPEFAVCPHSFAELSLPEAALVMYPELRALSTQVGEHLIHLCWKRPFDPKVN
jgi:hypothetical protein